MSFAAQYFNMVMIKSKWLLGSYSKPIQSFYSAINNAAYGFLVFIYVLLEAFREEIS